MRGDWMYDWVRVEMDYRAGPRPVSPRRTERKPARHWRALWAGLFAGQRPVGVPHGSSVS
ncbi:hypothetical protein ACIOD2_03810 [Amycolatopsis sp. NPDC088138]|uniref:hypothetical protein n=1 Tax=Amycolatopsis sp. NPDC088138 TaxID=3363938 RepID=UPI0037FF5525